MHGAVPLSFLKNLRNFAAYMDIDLLKNPGEVERLANRLQAAHIGHELVLADNIFSPLPSCDDGGPPISHPVKTVGASIVMCHDGNISYKVNLADHTLAAGDVLFILPGSIMQVVRAGADTRIATLSFGRPYYESMVDVDMRMRENPVVTPSETDFNECMTIYRLIHRHLTEDTADVARKIAKGYLNVVCTILFCYWKNAGDDASPAKSRPKELYRKFLDKIQNDYRSHRSLRHYADCLCVTPKYLSTIVKKESGRNAKEFIDELVVFESKALLKDGAYTVDQVSEMMCFPNPSFFARYFKQQCGLTPSAYRKK